MPATVDKHLLKAFIPGVLAPLMFVAAFVVPAHDPKPNWLPVAVAGPMSAASPVLGPLTGVKMLRVRSAAAAADAVRDRDAYGAVVGSPRPAVDVASGASFVFATMLKQAAMRAGIAPANIHELAPLPPGDPRGAVLSLVVLALLITSITGAALAMVHLPNLTVGRREIYVAGVGVLVGMGVTAILTELNALPGQFPAVSALLALLVFAVALIARFLIRLRGAGGTTLAFMFFLVMANPAAGLASAPDLLPAPWKELGPLLPPGAAGDALRGTLYFGGAKILLPVLILAGWAGAGAALNVVADRRVRASATGQVAQLSPSGAPGTAALRVIGSVPPSRHPGSDQSRQPAVLSCSACEQSELSRA